MMYEIKRLSIWSISKISFVLGAIFGFIVGIFVWMFAGLMSQIPFEEYGGGMESMEGLSSMGIMLPFFMAIFYGVSSMVVNAMITGLYNLLAGILGGVEMTLAESAPTATPYAKAAPAPPYSQAAPVQPPTAPPPPPPPLPPPGTG